MEHTELIDQLAAAADRLAAAAETLDRVLGKLDAQQEALNAKVDRIVAAVENERYTLTPVRTPRINSNNAFPSSKKQTPS
jgi:ABC-type transporter Mla subunit MlaD